ATAQDPFDRHPGQRVPQRSYKCFAPILSSGVAPTLHKKSWQPAGHGPMRLMIVRVLLRPDILSPSLAALALVILLVGVTVSFLPSPDETRIRTIPKEAKPRQTSPRIATFH